MKRRINSFHYFAPPSFLSKSKNAKGYNEIEKKFFGYFTLREVSRSGGFLCFVFSHIWTESYPHFPVYEQNRRFYASAHIRENKCTIRSTNGKMRNRERQDFGIVHAV